MMRLGSKSLQDIHRHNTNSSLRTVFQPRGSNDRNYANCVHTSDFVYPDACTLAWHETNSSVSLRVWVSGVERYHIAALTLA